MKASYPSWMSYILKVAAIYNILWGIWVVLFPDHFFIITGMEPLNHPMIWQGMGMVIGVYGLAYWWSSFNPVLFWPIVAVGFLGKLFGPIGFFINYVSGSAPIEFLYTLITNDFIWWIPFYKILKYSYEKTGWSLHS